MLPKVSVYFQHVNSLLKCSVATEGLENQISKNSLHVDLCSEFIDSYGIAGLVTCTVFPIQVFWFIFHVHIYQTSFSLHITEKLLASCIVNIPVCKPFEKNLSHFGAICTLSGFPTIQLYLW